ncbi:MAG: UPF0175 family protein [Bacteroidota bacterium]
MDLVIKEDILNQAHISAEELVLEIAVHLYDTERLSIGQARKLTNLDPISFQRELAKRDIFIKYDSDDLQTDLTNLAKIRNQKAS